MCKESETSQTTKSEVPGFVEDASKKLVNSATGLADQPYEPYTGQRVAGLTGDEKNAFQMLRDQISGAPEVLPEALGGARGYASAPAQEVGTERVVDEGGRLGQIDSYLNPYVDKALDPALRRINEAAAQQRIDIGDRATTAGAYGDARHGVVESNLNEATQQAVGDTAKTFYLDAFDKAMGLRGQDLDRFRQTDVQNAQLAETALDRQLTGTGQLLERSAADQQTKLNQIGALLGAGELQRDVSQDELDAAYEEFLREYNHSFDVVSALSSALSGLPFTRTKTTTSTQPDNSLLATAGSVAGSVLGGPIGGSIGSSIGSALGGGSGGGLSAGGTTWSPSGGGSSLPWL